MQEIVICLKSIDIRAQGVVIDRKIQKKFAVFKQLKNSGCNIQKMT